MISAVLCTRNDNYGGNLKERASYCLNSMIQTFDEVILVDWNSPNNIPLLWDIKDNIKFKGNLKHFIITPEIASLLTGGFPNAQVCCEVLARNIGIRRTQYLNEIRKLAASHCGDWIVSTNIDIIVPTREELDKTIEKLDQDTFYTISRRPLELDQIKQFDYWDINNLRNSIKSEERHWDEKVAQGDDYSLINCCGDFQLATIEVWHEIKGFEEDLIYVLYSDTNVQKKAVKHGFGLKALYQPPIFHINHGKGGGGFLDGINRITNDMYRAVIGQEKTENQKTWGFSQIEIEYETL